MSPTGIVLVNANNREESKRALSATTEEHVYKLDLHTCQR